MNIDLTSPTHAGLSNSIPLSSLSAGVVTLNHLHSGLIYASIGGPVAPNGSFTAPNPNNPTDPAYNYIWQSVAEIDYEGAPANSGDISLINFAALTSSVSVIANNSVVQHAGFVVPASTLTNQIGALSTTPDVVLLKASSGPNAGQTVRALGPNSFGPTKDTQGTEYNALGGFKNFQAYTQAVHASGQSTIISGVLGPGNFNFTLTVAANGDIVAVGNYGTGTTYTITIPADYALTDGSGLINYNQSSTIYFSPNSAGGFPGVVVSPNTMDAGELAQVLQNIWVGFNFGFINSATLDPKTNVPFGQESSDKWTANGTINTLFDKLQPNQPYYNQYAKLLAESSNYTVYGFPYSDDIGKVTLSTVQTPAPDNIPVTAWNILIGEDPFHGASLGGGWYYSSWFGYYNTTFYPWINQLDLGFMYVDTTDAVNLYLYYPPTGWLYTSQADFPNLYSFTQVSWLYYFTGSRTFANYNTGKFETY